MITSKQCTLILAVILILVANSCKKNIDFIKCGYDQPDAACLVTHTDDDLFGGVPIDIIYNKKGNPDSLNVSGTPITVQYDYKGRLLKVTFLNGLPDYHSDFLYKDNTFLPAIMKTYDSYYGGYIAIDSFHYNFRGEMIKIGLTNLPYPNYNSAEIYDYDNKHNVTKVTLKSANGGTAFIPGYTEYEATKYDDKPDFMSGNQWLKYILIDAGIDQYNWMMFSVNNVVNWHWGYQGGYNPVTSTLQYNAKGFATTVSLHVFDVEGGTDLLDFTRNSSSTCDPVTQSRAIKKSQHAALANSAFLSRNAKHIPSAIR